MLEMQNLLYVLLSPPTFIIAKVSSFVLIKKL